MINENAEKNIYLKSHWMWMLVLGIISIVLGFIGLGMSLALTMIGIYFFGMLLIVGGIGHFCSIFKERDSVFWHLLSGFLYIIAGGLIIYDPILASSIITFFVAIIFVIIGISRVVAAFSLKQPGSWWLIVAGIAGIFVGIAVIAQWPISTFWFIGMLIAIEMLVSGWSYVLIALGIRKLLRRPERIL